MTFRDVLNVLGVVAVFFFYHAVLKGRLGRRY
jgi:hypothetical protein